MNYRVRIIFPNGRIAVLDKAFSQTIEMLRNADFEQRKAFWNKKEVALPTDEGDYISVVLVREGV